jgi:hypothetical protein
MDIVSAVIIVLQLCDGYAQVCLLQWCQNGARGVSEWCHSRVVVMYLNFPH